jgi:hypothetical protein
MCRSLFIGLDPVTNEVETQQNGDMIDQQTTTKTSWFMAFFFQVSISLHLQIMTERMLLLALALF